MCFSSSWTNHVGELLVLVSHISGLIDMDRLSWWRGFMRLGRWPQVDGQWWETTWGMVDPWYLDVVIMSFPAKVEMFSRHWDGIHPWKTLVIVDIKRMGPHHLFAIGPINHSGKNTWTASIFEFWIYVMNWWNSFIVDHYKCFQNFFTFSLLQGIVKWCLLLPMSY